MQMTREAQSKFLCEQWSFPRAKLSRLSLQLSSSDRKAFDLNPEVEVYEHTYRTWLSIRENKLKETPLNIPEAVEWNRRY